MKAALAIVLFAAPVWAVDLQVDPAHSSASFAVKHMMVSTVRGNFGKVTGKVTYDPKDPTRSSASIEIDPASIDTRNQQRDTHLKSADFFDVGKCPEMTFKSTKVEKGTERDGSAGARAGAEGGGIGGKYYKVSGDLTMHCTTRPVTLDVEGFNGPVKGSQGANLYATTATGKLSRKDFGLTWNKALEAGGVAVGDDVLLTVELELNDSPAAAKKEAQAESKPQNK
jgi:polyisoprenoid-binding protein YceI